MAAPQTNPGGKPDRSIASGSGSAAMAPSGSAAASEVGSASGAGAGCEGGDDGTSASFDVSAAGAAWFGVLSLTVHTLQALAPTPGTVTLTR